MRWSSDWSSARKPAWSGRATMQSSSRLQRQRPSSFREIGKTRQAEARPRRTLTKYGVPAAAARHLQMAIVQGPCSTRLSPPGTTGREWRGSTRRLSTEWGESAWAPSGRCRWESRRQKQTHAGQSSSQLRPGQMHSATPVPPQRSAGARGGDRTAGRGPHSRTTGSSDPATRRDDRGAEVGEIPALPG